MEDRFFHTAFRGFDKEEVLNYLEGLIELHEKEETTLTKENAKTKQDYRELVQKYNKLVGQYRELLEQFQKSEEERLRWKQRSARAEELLFQSQPNAVPSAPQKTTEGQFPTSGELNHLLKKLNWEE